MTEIIFFQKNNILINEKIFLYDENESDSFADSYTDFTKLEIVKKENYKEIKLYFEEKEVIIKINEDNQIIGLIDNNITKLEVILCLIIILC